MGSVASTYFSTRELPAAQQCDAWCAWYDQVFDLREMGEAGMEGFPADNLCWNLGGALFSRVRAPRLHSVRGPSHLRRDPSDHWVVALGQRQTELRLGGQEVLVQARQPFVVSLAEPVESRRGADDRLQLYLPRDRFAALARELDGVRGMPLAGPMGRLLAEYLAMIARSLPELTAAEAPRLHDTIAPMLAACIAPTAERMEAAAGQIDLTRLERVRQAIRRRLSSATLTPEALCREVGMSRSRLYRLLESEGGVVRYVQRLRLRASYAALSDPEDGRSIAAIAESCGFYEPSSFSRTFRKEFGATPSEVRNGAPMQGPAGRAALPAAETPSLRGWLRAAA